MQRIAYIEIIKELNAGGTSKIYLGVNSHTGFPVAVKELDSQLFRNPDIKRLFINEANRYLYLDHPNIVKLEDLLLLPTHDTGYLVMEYIDGKNLKEYIKGVTGPLPFENAAMFVNEALKAIEFAHESGFIHKNFYFLSEKEYIPGSDYDKFMRNLFSYMKIGDNQKDGAPDATAGLSRMIQSFPSNVLFK